MNYPTLNEFVPVYLKGGFKMRDHKPLGVANHHDEAWELVQAAAPVKQVGANGHDVTNGPRGVVLEQDEKGRYFVGTWILQVHAA